MADLEKLKSLLGDAFTAEVEAEVGEILKAETEGLENGGSAYVPRAKYDAVKAQLEESKEETKDTETTKDGEEAGATAGETGASNTEDVSKDAEGSTQTEGTEENEGKKEAEGSTGDETAGAGDITPPPTETGDDVDYKAKSAELEAELTKVKQRYALDKILANYKPRNAKAVEALLDKEKISYSTNEETGELIVEGLKEQLDTLKSKESYLFNYDEYCGTGIPQVNTSNNNFKQKDAFEVGFDEA